MTTESLLLIERHAADGYAVLTLNRPGAMNALSLALRRALVVAIDDLARDDAVRAIVLTGAGRAFCAGLDLKELGQSSAEAEALGGGWQTDPVRALARCPKPVIAAINGAAITGGFELALACDILIGAPEARFADTHARIGVMPGWGLSQKLSRLVGVYRAKEISLTGNFVGADQAVAWGILNRVVPTDELLTVARRLATDIASCPPHMTVAYKKLIDDGLALDLGAALALATERSRSANKRIAPGEIEARREGVRKRGQEQG